LNNPLCVSGRPFSTSKLYIVQMLRIQTQINHGPIRSCTRPRKVLLQVISKDRQNITSYWRNHYVFKSIVSYSFRLDSH
jgi:hypothetical protein